MKKRIVLIFAFILVFSSFFTEANLNAAERKVIYFKETTCLVCAEVAGYPNGYSGDYVESLDYLKKMEDQGITVIVYDIMKNDIIPEYSYEEDGETVEVTAIDVYAAFNDAYNRSQTSVPVIFVGDQYFVGLDDIRDAVDNNTVFDLSDDDLLEVNVREGEAYRDITGIVGFFTVVGAGLLDGFNPCAIALLLLFVSLLGFSKDKKILIFVSATYIFALFISYFLIGTVFLSIFETFSDQIAIVGKIVNWVVLILVTIFLLLNLYDYFQAKRENYKNIKNQLPKWIQRSNKKIVKAFTDVINSEDNKGLIPILGITFLLGVTLSVTELVCTGQIYFGILYGIHTLGSAYAYLLLFIYNIMFVLPLIVIAVVAIKLNGVILVTNWLREKMHIIKLVNAIFFLLIAIYFAYRIFG